MNKLLNNNEKRIRRAVVGTLQAVMPGEQSAEQNKQHIIGYLPKGALIDNATAFIKDGFGANVTVDFGTEDNPKRFMDGRVLVTSSNTDNKTPLDYLAANGQPLVVTYSTAGTDAGVLLFEVSFTEIDTKAGMYTA